MEETRFIKILFVFFFQAVILLFRDILQAPYGLPHVRCPQSFPKCESSGACYPSHRGGGALIALLAITPAIPLIQYKFSSSDSLSVQIGRSG